ncbi:hypothetical protein FHS42_006703 [Streptomyces zagrosensis]|uniref:Uncharacterized protein n=1 Tax=Streptomyces zagrosensis TaxID=1042984 RepID=A0A7W9QIJ2_9ACTN|nr:hypothetical protein [Streptomyces zagrosensis]
MRPACHQQLTLLHAWKNYRGPQHPPRLRPRAAFSTTTHTAAGAAVDNEPVSEERMSR